MSLSIALIGNRPFIVLYLLDCIVFCSEFGGLISYTLAVVMVGCSCWRGGGGRIVGNTIPSYPSSCLIL